MATKTQPAEHITKIAAQHGIETLNTRNSDSLDFHELGVWQIRAMLEAAYEAGLKAAQSKQG